MTTHQHHMDTPTTSAMTRDVFDIVVVGAGVVGCAIARRFTLEGARVAIVEKAPDILDGASKANSAILHTGFDAPPGSLELACIKEGHEEYCKIRHDLNLPLEKTGAHVVAWNDDEVARLAGILRQAHQNGITDTRMIDGKELGRNEPALKKSALAAIFIPGESIIDPWSAPYAYLKHSMINGGQVFLSCEVTGGVFDGEKWQLQTTGGTLAARHVINCAGLYGDRLDQTVLGIAKFSIRPRKGQFVVFDKAASRLVNSIILPVPTNRTKGMLVCRTIFGNLLVGPTAEDQDSRNDTSTDEETAGRLIAAGIDIIPALEKMPVTAIYAGLRPATEVKEYRIETEPGRNWITVGGIRSTGLSSALGIAGHVFRTYCAPKPRYFPVKAPRKPQTPFALSENTLRDWQQPGHGQIVCHCELVTEREIRAALSGALAARSLAALKRQTRATMGRCQGFYCSARLAELTDGHFDTPMSVKADHDK